MAVEVSSVPDTTASLAPSLRPNESLSLPASGSMMTWTSWYAVMVQPMIMGLSNFAKLVRENLGIAFFAHPTLAGAARISPRLLFGKIFRMLGADALVFPNHGGRFGYSPDTCRDLAQTALAEWWCKPAVPVPAGGMTIDRVGEMLDFYGADVMLLIGGALLQARERLTQETAAFVAKVKGYRYG